MITWIGRVGLTLLVLASMPSTWAQESVAVIGATSAGGEAPPYELVAAIEAALGEKVAINDRSALTELSMSQNADPGEVVVAELARKLGTAVDAFFDTPDQAELLLLEAVDSTEGHDLWLVDQPLLVAQLRSAEFTLVRSIMGRAAFEEAQSTMFEIMARHPLWTPSAKSYPPDIISLSGQAVAQVLALGYRLRLNRMGAVTCEVNVNGGTVVLDGAEREVSVANRSYAVKLSCGSGEDEVVVGPFVLEVNRVNVPLYLNPAILSAMAPLRDAKPPTMPEKDADVTGLATNLHSILGADALLTVTRGGDGFVVAQATPQGITRVTTPETTQDAAQKLLAALETGKPTMEVAIDVDGSGFQRLEAPEPPSIWGPVGLLAGGGAIAIAGAALLAVAATDEGYKDCVERECTEKEWEDKAGGLATNQLVSHILLGVGGAVVVGGAVWLALVLATDDTVPEGVSMGLSVGRDGGMATFEWRW